MPTIIGKERTCLTHGTTVIATRAGDGELMCAGALLQEGRGNKIAKGEGEAYRVALGKRYVWPEPPPPPKEGEEPVAEVVPRTEVLCIVPGDCALAVDENMMLELQPKVLPSAD